MYTLGIAGALRVARSAKRLSQEDFGDVTSRVYVSEVERGLKKPTFSKIEELAAVLGIHPLTLCALACIDEASALDDLLLRVAAEVREILTTCDKEQ